MEHKGFTLWFTGLSGSGKSTVANIIEKKLETTGTARNWNTTLKMQALAKSMA